MRVVGDDLEQQISEKKHTIQRRQKEGFYGDLLADHAQRCDHQHEDGDDHGGNAFGQLTRKMTR